MRLLIIATRLPYPPLDGLVIPLYELIRELSSRHELWLAAYVEKNEPGIPERSAHLSSMCKEVIVLPKLSRKSALLRGLNTGLPVSVVPYASADARRRVSDLLLNRSIDGIVCHLAHTAEALEKTCTTPACMIVQDALYHLVRLNSRLHKSALKRAYYAVEAERMFRFERATYSRFLRCAVVSQAEKERVLALKSGVPVDVVPNGVDACYYKPDSSIARSKAILYMGALGASRNESAAWVLSTEIFPRLRVLFPALELWIVGDCPSQRLLDIGRQDPNINVTGQVVETLPYLQSARLFICAQWMGTGIKNSVLQALAAGLPALLSPAAAEGFEGTPGHDYIVCNNPDEFVTAASRVLTDEIFASQLSAHGRQLVCERYTWIRYAECIEDMLHIDTGKLSGSPAGIA